MWNCDDLLCFDGSGSNGKISSDGSVTIPVTSIDGYFSNMPLVPTFIKLDVEGAEKNSILGAKQTIAKYKPKLAVCVYHKPEDIYELPTLINELNPNYRFYLRCYCNSFKEIVVYAV